MMEDIEAIRTVDIQEMQQTLSDMVESVHATGDPCIITRDGESVVVVIRYVEFFFLIGMYLMHKSRKQEPPDGSAD